MARINEDIFAQYLGEMVYLTNFLIFRNEIEKRCQINTSMKN